METLTHALAVLNRESKRNQKVRSQLAELMSSINQVIGTYPKLGFLSEMGKQVSIASEDLLEINRQYEKAIQLLNEPSAVNCRTSVRWFAEKMEEKLKANDHKGGWGDEKVTYLRKRINDELAELDRALEEKNAERVIKEASDISNFCLMIADKHGNNYGE